jgi:hypothetical protein
MHCRLTSRPRLKPLPTIALGIFCVFSWPTKALAAITDQQASAIADKAILKFGIGPPYWTSQLEKSPDDWYRTRASWEKWLSTQGMERSADTKARIEEIENAIKGKEVWLVVYRAVVPPGQKVFHTHAIVFLDAKTGDVLPIKHQEE